MLRNDYRRALIMLRPMLGTKGMSGHVRLERRTLMGSMRFTVTGADSGDMLYALLMADTKDSMVVYRLGTLAKDSRGQSGATATFDPRNLNGLDLNDYTLIALVREGTGDPQLVMTGMVNGSKELNWAEVEDAATRLYKPGGKVTQPTQAVQGGLYAEKSGGVSLAGGIAPEPDCPCDLEEGQAVFERAAPPSLLSFDIEQAPEATEEPDEEEIYGEPGPEAPAEITPSPQEAREGPTAAEVLELDEDALWPDEIASLRVLFFTAHPSNAFTLDDFVFVDAPLPSEDGTEGVCAIGLEAQDGQPVSVCYALPGDFSLEPPPGLEGYQYASGWWYTILSALEPDPE